MVVVITQFQLALTNFFYIVILITCNLDLGQTLTCSVSGHAVWTFEHCTAQVDVEIHIWILGDGRSHGMDDLW